MAARADPSAFGAVYERYVGAIYRYCHVRLGDRLAAEDATSEVFLKALAGLSSFRGDGFTAWLFRIAHNVVVDRYRRPPIRAADLHPLLADGSAAEPLDPDPEPAEAIVAADEAATLRSAIEQLPSDQRAVIELQLAGWSGSEIGAALGRSADAVKMIRFRAVAKLRALLIVERSPARGQGVSR